MARQEMLDIGFAHDRTTGKEDWLTPPEIIKALGPFHLDPCSPVNRPWDTAIEHYTIEHNGLKKPWFGSVWLNPPYGRETPRWLERMADHNNGIALIYARTDTAAFQDYVFTRAACILWIRGRLHFYTAEGKVGGRAGAPSCLVAYGAQSRTKLICSGIDGQISETKRGRA